MEIAGVNVDTLTMMWYPVAFLLGWQITAKGIKTASESFIAAGLKGNDMGREDRPLVRI